MGDRAIASSRSGPARIIGRGIAYVLLSGVALVMIGPFLWMVVTSLTPSGELYRYPPTIPSTMQVGNYAEVFSRFPFVQFSINSFAIAIVATIGTLVSASLAAYAFARMEFR